MEKINNEVEKLNADEEFRTMANIENEQNSIRIKYQKEKQLEIAKSMLKDHLPLETISKYTGLPLEQIENLK